MSKKESSPVSKEKKTTDKRRGRSPKRQGDHRPVQQAVPGRLGLILRGLNGSTCWTVPAHLKDGPSRAGPWTPTYWPGMAHKPGGLAVPTGHAGGPCRRAVPAGPCQLAMPTGCDGGPCRWAVSAGRANEPCRWVVSTGRAGRLAHIKFCFVIKSNFFLKKLYIICGNANFLFLKPRKNILYIYIYMFFKITKNLKY